MLAMTWNHINTQADADRLFDLFGGFHDGCLRELHVSTEDYVDLGLSMHCANGLGTKVRLLVQRQFSPLSAIELLFEGVVIFHLNAPLVGHDPSIFDATLLYEDETFYWAAMDGWSPASEHRDRCTWISAKKLSWRDASDWMGLELRYHND